MRLVTDPDVYGQSAQLGIFIPLKEMALIKGFDALEKSAIKAYNKADKKREYYQDLQDSGEASERQTTALSEWDARACDAERILESIKSAKHTLLPKK